MREYSQAQQGNALLAPRRFVCKKARLAFLLWTVLFWGGVVVFAILFYTGSLSFTTSAKASLYGISIWLNGWALPLAFKSLRNRPWDDVAHECLSLWLLSYAMTNLAWEIPWIICSPFVFHNISTLEDVVDHTAWMREHPTHMGYWALASFSSVDLRTINHNSTFYTLELYAFVNVASILYFFHLNRKRSSARYLIPVLGSGEPVAATLIFSFSEVVGGFKNMPGGVADTLLALLWTQYQYVIFPFLFGIVGVKLLFVDWQHCFGIPPACKASPTAKTPLLLKERGSDNEFHGQHVQHT